MPVSITPPPADDEIECGHCGAYIPQDLTRCPHCGINLYEPDDGSKQSTQAVRRYSRSHHSRIGNRLDEFIRRITNKPYAVDELFGASINQAELFDELLRKVGGDRAIAERLVEFERQKQPEGNRMKWLTSAIQRWEHDNQISGTK